MDDLINRQAAIDALGEEPPVWYDGEDEIAERNQWKRDIEAIKQLPPANCSEFPNNSDTISRQAAINEFCHSCDGWNCNPNTCCKTEWIRKLSVIQPKRGKWIHDGSKWTNRWICSECGYKWFFDCIEGAFCPNCGAKMEEVTE